MGSCCGANASTIKVMPAIIASPTIKTPPLSPPKCTDALLTPRKDDTTFLKSNETSFRLSGANMGLKVEPMLFRCERKLSPEERYEHLEMIGKGSFGEVRKVKDVVTGKISVMKSIQKSRCQRSELVVDEIEILKQLDHPHIARFYEFYQDELNYYLIMEYCPGGDLLSLLLNHKSISEREAARILRQILSALEYCHKHHIVHRDIKPENIVLTGGDINSTLKVIDFGRSKILKPQTKLLELAGSVPFLFFRLHFTVVRAHKKHQ